MLRMESSTPPNIRIPDFARRFNLARRGEPLTPLGRAHAQVIDAVSETVDPHPEQEASP